MNQPQKIFCDIAIIGSGFAGSLAALCLQQKGFDVCLIEKSQHPRFAIGESSTPIADMVLRSLVSEYKLPWLRPFSRYGSWQDHYPHIDCGIKRGFSYFMHQKEKPFATSAQHSHELLVAASVSNRQSDTNWLRSDFDAFLVEKVKEYDIPYFDHTNVHHVHRDEQWTIQAASGDRKLGIECSFLLDASGSGSFASNHLGVASTKNIFKTHTRALYTHFDNVPLWSDALKKMGISRDDYPYDPDLSALHHLMQNGWLWMLRFNTGRTSTGLVQNMDKTLEYENLPPAKEWHKILERYPSLHELFANATIANKPGNIIRTGRLQRRLNKAVGERWAALPHTAGFVDPLHSTGIAHTLTGLEQLLGILESTWHKPDERRKRLKNYEKSVFQELELIDLLVAGCYKSLPDFDLFTSYTMLYFAASIRYEQQRLKGTTPTHFLCADNEEIQQIVQESYADLVTITQKSISTEAVHLFRERIKDRIKPFNTAGLLQPEAHNMYHHTATELD